MSSDLWAAFGANGEDPASNPWAQTSPGAAPAIQSAVSAWPASSRPPATSPAPLPSFSPPAVDPFPPIPSPVVTPAESALAPIIPSIAPPTSQTSEPADDDVLWDLEAELDHAQRSSQDLMSGENEAGDNQEWGALQSPWVNEATLPSPAPPKAMQSPSDTADDGFGEFESPEDPSQPSAESDSQQRSSVNQTHLSTPGQSEAQPPRGGESKPAPSDPFAGLEHLGRPKDTSVQLKTVKDITLKDIPVRPRRRVDLIQEIVPYSPGEWGEFSPEPTSSPAAMTKAASARSQPSSEDRTQKRASATENSTTTHRQSKSSQATSSDIAPQIATKSTTQPSRQKADASAPTNVPPPSLLLSLMAGLVQKLPGQIQAAMQHDSRPNISDRRLEKALRSCIAALRVGARILAGRKVRWKRDPYLAPSMRIGAASSGRAGGMKLTGVDKSEQQREDREAAELVRVWKQQAGGIRSALARVTGQLSGPPLTLPEIALTMPLRALSSSEGGVTASRACFLCGMQRHERLERVDGDVLDAFDEWWITHWGHVECQAFWLDHEPYLRRQG